MYNILYNLFNMQQKQPFEVRLDIPYRLQWENGHGFCGQTSLQMCGLFYGNYVSQKIIRDVAGGELLIGENDEKAFKKLGYEYEQWNTEKEKVPQYKNYLQWIKKHIKQESPVIITGYCEDQDSQEYDHIYLAIGVQSRHWNEFNQDDRLIWIDCFQKKHLVTRFDDIWDTRQLKGNGKKLDFVIPKYKNFGVAIQGVVDRMEIFLPVKISLNNNIQQPNVSLGQKPKQLNAKIIISDLKAGTNYVLMRFDSVNHIPKANIDPEEASKVHKFTATAQTYNFEDSFYSNQAIFYRCVEAADLN